MHLNKNGLEIAEEQLEVRIAADKLEDVKPTFKEHTSAYVPIDKHPVKKTAKTLNKT